MKLYEALDLATYPAVQIARSQSKLTFFNVAWEDVKRYHVILPEVRSVCCLGVRGGMEVTYFAETFGEAVGVEINPACARPDVWIGSFDAMPESWAGRFDAIFSNALDHSCQPWSTAREWRRIVRPGGYAILAWIEGQAPSETDPLGDLTLEDIRALFPGALVADGVSAAGYREAIIALEPV